MKRDKISNARIIKELNNSLGILTQAAKKLRIDRNTLADWIAQDEELQLAHQSAREMLIDESESELVKNIRAGKEASIIFSLKTLGRNRGYVERIEYAEHIEQELFGDADHSFDPEDEDEDPQESDAADNDL